MIEFVNGDIFKSRADALVNPVNCDGVMGKGLAKEFKLRWPEMYRSYQHSCASGELRPGTVIIYRHSLPQIILFATKASWRNPSEYQYIEDGIRDLKMQLPVWCLKSIAMPAIGCGLGGLDWNLVKQMLQRDLRDIPTRIEIYEPV